MAWMVTRPQSGLNDPGHASQWHVANSVEIGRVPARRSGAPGHVCPIPLRASLQQRRALRVRLIQSVPDHSPMEMTSAWAGKILRNSREWTSASLSAHPSARTTIP